MASKRSEIELTVSMAAEGCKFSKKLGGINGSSGLVGPEIESAQMSHSSGEVLK